MDQYDTAVAQAAGEPLAGERLEINDIVGNDGTALCSGQLKDLRIQ